MNFLSYRREAPVPESSLIREETLLVDSRGEVCLITRHAVRCAAGRHLVKRPDPCAACEREWWWSQGFITEIGGWVSGTLKVANAERAVLAQQGWTVQKITAQYTHMVPPADAEEILLPLAEPNEIPGEVRRRFTLAQLPELPPEARTSLTRLGRKDLMAYKRLAPSFQSLEEHLSYLSSPEATGPRPRR